MEEDIRWKQRFDNYEKAILYLEEALKIPNPDIIQKAGIIQFFEMCFELSWKLLKDFLEEQGFTEVNSPRAAFKKSFETGILKDGHAWMELLLDRNLTAHVYDEEKAAEVEKLIRQKYFLLLHSLYERFKAKHQQK